MPPKISLVVPVFNEEGNIAKLHQEIKSVCEENHYDYEIILVDDGSTDRTGQILKTLSPAKVIFFRRNFGQTAAMDAGIHAASGEYIITLDGDGQNDPHDIPKLVQALEAGGLDVVSGWRKDRKDSFGKRLVSRVANFLRGILINDGIHDSGCSLKIYKKECFSNLRLYGEMHRFVPAILQIRGFKIGEIVVNHRPRVSGRTHYDWRRSVKGLIDMISVWFWNKFAVRPLHLLGGMGFVLILLGTLSSAYTYFLYLKGQSLSDTVWPVLAAFFLLTGVQLFISGLLADFLSKTYYETTQNKSYHIKEITEKR